LAAEHKDIVDLLFNSVIFWTSIFAKD